MDKQAIFLPTARQIKRVLAAGLCLLLAACATSGQEQAPPPVAETDQTRPLDSEVMMHLATAERLADVGEHESALGEYLAAARASDDPEIARVVTRLAGRLQSWPMAAAAAERWLEIEPQAESASHVRIIALVNQGLETEAVEAIVDWRARSDRPDLTEWRRTAMLLATATEHETAQAVYSRLVEQDAGNTSPAELMHAESIMLWRHGELAAARQRAQAAAADSDDSEYLVWAAQLNVEGGDLDEALALYRRARSAHPEEAGLALAEAEVLRQLKRNDEALDLLRALPAEHESLYTLGIYLVQLERAEEAEAVWEQLAALPGSADDPEKSYLIAQLAELIERDEQAAEWYRRIDSGPRQERARLRLAIVLGRLEQIPEAQVLLAELRDQVGHDMALDTWLIEAELLRSSGQAERAVDLLAEPLAENSSNIDLLYARAISAATAGNVDLAEQDLRRIIQIDPDNGMALNALGYTLTDQTDRHYEAYRLIRRALEFEPDDPATLDSMGWVLFRLGRAEEAVEYLERAAAGDRNPEILAHLVEVLHSLDRQLEAQELARLAHAEFPEDSLLAGTLERLNLDLN